MKFFSFLAFFALANSHKLEVIVNLEVESVVFHAIKGILEEHFAPNEPKVNFYFSGPNSEALAELLVREKPLDLTFRMINLDLIDEVLMDAPSIFLFDSGKHYYGVYKRILPIGKNFVYYNHLMYVAKNDTEFTPLEFRVEKENFLIVVNETTVNLTASFRFTPELCHWPQYRTINQFTTDTMKWQNKTFFPEKYENFHGCPLRVATHEMTTTTAQMIVESLADHFNFRIVRVPFDDINSKESVDLIEYTIFLHTNFDKPNFRFSSTLYDDFLTFTVPTGEPFTQLEKMFLMFDKATWICIGVTLGAAVLVIQFINFMSIKVQKFVFGRDIQAPTLNVASIFLTGGQHRVPRRNFARYMLMMFIMWSLIIRTCYQSKLYKNLQGDMRKQQIRTIDELNEEKFTLYLHENEYLYRQYSADRINLRHMTEILDSSLYALYENKITTMTSRKEFRSTLFKTLKQESSLRLLEENSETALFCMLFLKTVPFSSTFISKLDQLITSGIIAWSEEKRTFVPKQNEEFEPQQLTMDHLGICFLAIMICLGLSCIAFIVECTVRYFIKRLPWQQPPQTAVHVISYSDQQDPEDVSIA